MVLYYPRLPWWKEQILILRAIFVSLAVALAISCFPTILAYQQGQTDMNWWQGLIMAGSMNVGVPVGLFLFDYLLPRYVWPPDGGPKGKEPIPKEAQPRLLSLDCLLFMTG